MRAVASVHPWALSLIFVTSCMVVTSLEAAEPSGAASAPYRHVHALVQAAGVETGHHAELLVTNAAAGGTPLAVRSRRDLHSGSEDAQSSDTPGSEELPPGGDGGAQQPPPSDGATNAASTIRSPAAAAVELSDEGAAEPRDGGSSEAASDVPQTVPENQTPSEKTQPAEPDDNTSVDATFTLPVLEEVEQDDVESPIEPEDAPKANREAASPLVTSPGSSAVDSSSPPQEASPPESPAVDSSGRTAPNIPTPDTADEEKEGSVLTEPHDSTSDETDVNNNNNNNNNGNNNNNNNNNNNGNDNDNSSENRNDKSNENNNSGNNDHDENSSNEPDAIADEKITKEGAAGGDDSAAATSSSEEDPGDSAEDYGAGSPSDSAPGVGRSPARTVNGTVLESGPGPWDSPADRARRRNVTTFALVMCGIVGATFVILVGMWINRMRHRDRLRSLEDHDDEEFTVFSASEARYITNSSGGGYEPLR